MFGQFRQSVGTHFQKTGAGTRVEQAVPELYDADRGQVSERLMNITTLWPASDRYLIDVSIGLVFAEHGPRCALSRKTETLSLREARMPCDLRAVQQFTPVCLASPWASVHVKRDDGTTCRFETKRELHEHRTRRMNMYRESDAKMQALKEYT